MTSDEELVLIFGALHLIAASLGCLLLYMFMRSEETVQWHPPTEDDDSGGGGGNDRVPTAPSGSRPPGGIPLPYAEQSRHRLRGHGRLADAYERRGRRAVPEPVRAPARRTPARR